MRISHLAAFALLLLGPLDGGILQATPQQFARDVAPETVGVRPEAIAKMDALLQSFVDEQKAGGLVAFVAKGGTVVYRKAYGWRDVENRVPASVDDYYVLFSQTKAVTTVAFMTLVEQGLVGVDDPVSKYFPEISDQVVTKVNEDGMYETRPVKSPMTFAHLMSHTSGLGACVRFGEPSVRRATRPPASAARSRRGPPRASTRAAAILKPAISRMRCWRSRSFRSVSIRARVGTIMSAPTCSAT
jgi:CubicO group peptidase (beta-lactamase class C family)